MDEKEKKTTKKTTTTKKTSSTAKKSVAAKKETTPKKSVASKSASSKTKPATKTVAASKAKPATKSTTKTASKKTTSKVNENKKTTSAKTTPKKTTTKKTPAKKTVTPKKNAKVEVEAKNLEHTIIFDGLENQNISDVVNNLEEENVVVDDKVIKRSKVRKVIIVILYLLIIAVIIATTVYILKENNKKKMEKEEPVISETINSNVYKKANDYYDNSNEIAKEEIDPKSSYSNIINIGLSSFEKMALEKKDAHILVASSTCYYCAIFEETVNEAYKESNKKIYRLDITKLTDDEVKKFRQYYAFRSTPTIFAIKDGIVKSDIVGTTSKENLINWINE